MSACARLPLHSALPEDSVLSCSSSVGEAVSQGVSEWKKATQLARSKGEKIQRPLRTAFFQLALPRTAEEASRSNQMGVLALTLVSHEKQDFPLGQVLLKPQKMGQGPGSGTLVDLPRSLPGNWVQDIPAHSETYQWLGSWIQTAYYYFPLRFLDEKASGSFPAEVVARTQGKLTTISAGVFPRLQELSKDSQSTLTHYPIRAEDSSRLPEMELTFAMLKRDFCFGATLELP